MVLIASNICKSKKAKGVMNIGYFSSWNKEKYINVMINGANSMTQIIDWRI